MQLSPGRYHLPATAAALRPSRLGLALLAFLMPTENNGQTGRCIHVHVLNWKVGKQYKTLKNFPTYEY